MTQRQSTVVSQGTYSYPTLQMRALDQRDIDFSKDMQVIMTVNINLLHFYSDTEKVGLAT